MANSSKKRYETQKVPYHALREGEEYLVFGLCKNHPTWVRVKRVALETNLLPTNVADALRLSDDQQQADTLQESTNQYVERLRCALIQITNLSKLSDSEEAIQRIRVALQGVDL